MESFLAERFLILRGLRVTRALADRERDRGDREEALSQALGFLREYVIEHHLPRVEAVLVRCHELLHRPIEEGGLPSLRAGHRLAESLLAAAERTVGEPRPDPDALSELVASLVEHLSGVILEGDGLVELLLGNQAAADGSVPPALEELARLDRARYEAQRARLEGLEAQVG